jgi:molybdopterin-guanine dinucleotide biosynthesis protein A
LNVGIIILAGGRGLRVGGQDKGWCLYIKKPFIKIVLEKLQQQSKIITKHNFTIVISVNRNIEAYQQLGVLVLADQRKNYCGPLSGIETVMKSQKEQEIDRWIVYPVDSVLVPKNYLTAMLSIEKKQTAYMVQNQQDHYAHLSIASEQQAIISTYLDANQRSIKGWLKNIKAVAIDLMTKEKVLNLNENT